MERSFSFLPHQQLTRAFGAGFVVVGQSIAEMIRTKVGYLDSIKNSIKIPICILLLLLMLLLLVLLVLLAF